MNLAGLWRYATEDSPEFMRPEYNDSAWTTMRLPQNWFLGGLDHHGVVWYRREFRHRGHPGKYATLRFDGVDYFAEVYLNGEFLGRHSGYFEPFEFDITPTLRSGKNLLAVRVESPYEAPGLDGWYMRKKLIKGILNHHDCRPGGAWQPIGQSYNTGGIWNRIGFEEHGPVTIEHVLLRADLNARAPLLHADISLNNRNQKRRSQIEVCCTPENFEGKAYRINQPFDLPEGRSHLTIDLPVPDVIRWNPWDRGEPRLYAVSVTIEEAEFATLFGFRTVRVDEGFHWWINEEPYFPRGSNYIASQWLAETLFPDVSQGKNHPFGGHPLDQATPAKANPPTPWFERDVALAKEANLNLLRVHGHVLPPEFHEVCDRAGILVWQDFPLQWGYTDEADFQDEAERQMRAMLTLLYNHPSIIAWCCHNESPSEAPWMATQAGGHYDPAHNRDLDIQLERTARELDPTRHVHQNSGTGDGHAYQGWYVGSWHDFTDLPGAPFVSEYGAQGLPCKETLLRTFVTFGADAGYAELSRLKVWIESYKKVRASTELLMKAGMAAWNFAEKRPSLKARIEKWAMNHLMNTERSIYQHLPPAEEMPEELQRAREVWESWQFHDFQPMETFENGIGLGASLDEFIDNSQFYQSTLIQAGTEAYRLKKMDKVTGIFQFDFTDPWPAVTWSVLDYWRRPKPSYDALRRAMQPVLPCFQLPFEIEAGKALPSTFQAVNDLLTAFPHTRCEWRMENINGYIASATFTIDIPANGVSSQVQVTLPSLPAGKIRLLVTLSTPQGKGIGENLYELRAEKKRTS
ncbi:MAG: sugar-binding domain-containing protein [Anaerolineales bacterium]|jgi:beta-galactosidase/beta-glucuronidase